MSKNTLCVYDTITKKYVEIEVNDEVYMNYRQTGWAIKNNDRSFFDHEIQFSMLKGRIDGAFENFHEFVEESPVEKYAAVASVKKALNTLPTKDRELIKMIFYKGMTERECADELKTTQQNIHKKKERILCILNKLLKS